MKRMINRIAGGVVIAIAVLMLWRLTPSADTVAALTDSFDGGVGVHRASAISAGETLLNDLLEITAGTAARDQQDATFQAAEAVMTDLRVILYGESWHSVTLFFATNRVLSGDPDPDTPEDQFTADVGDLKYGTATVTIPVNHQVGHLESQSRITSFFVAPDPEKHVILNAMTVQPVDLVMQDLGRVLQGGETSTLFYIHGFNVGVDTAARRAGQLTYDLDWNGPSFFFSWPSGNSMGEYDEDQTKARSSRRQLQQVLETIAATDTDRIVIISHSMGTDLLTQALDYMSAANSPALGKIETVILAAADIDSIYFQSTIVPAIADIRARHARFNVTVYASERDSALWLSDVENGNTRIGYKSSLTPEEIAALKPVQMVDASLAETNFFGHTYINDNPTVIGDVYCMLRNGPDPAVRATLIGLPDPHDGPAYRITARPAPQTRPDGTLDNTARRKQFVCNQEDLAED